MKLAIITEKKWLGECFERTFIEWKSDKDANWNYYMVDTEWFFQICTVHINQEFISLIDLKHNCSINIYSYYTYLYSTDFREQ